MSTRDGVLLAVVATVALSGGCVASKQKHFQHVQQMVQERTAYQVRWYQGRPEDLFVSEQIQSLLDEPLSLRVAVQIALLNNPTLQSEYEGIGVSQADLVQAGLLKNPSSWSRTRWPDRPPTKPDAEFALSQDILDVFLLPLRRKIASMELEQAKLRLAQTVLATINRGTGGVLHGPGRRTGPGPLAGNVWIPRCCLGSGRTAGRASRPSTRST